MAVTKRTRFEVLRRDSHTCQYCGQMAPDVVLHIDHVIPTALGGNDKPDNLVAACRDCNAGKSSIAPDSPIVTAVSARSAEYVLAVANRGAQLEADFNEMEQYEEEFILAWEAWQFGGKSIDPPLDWRRSLKIWWGLKVPLKVLEHGVEVAMSSKSVPRADKFRYMAGIVWRTLDDYDARYPVVRNEGRVFGPKELEDHGIDEWRRGYRSGQKVARHDNYAIDFLAQHIDGNLLVPQGRF